MRPRIPSVDFRNLQLSADLDVGIDLARVFQRDLQNGILDLLRSLNHGLHRKRANLTRILVEFRTQIFLRLVVFTGRDHNRVFHRTDYDLRINPFSRLSASIVL